MSDSKRAAEQSRSSIQESSTQNTSAEERTRDGNGIKRSELSLSGVSAAIAFLSTAVATVVSSAQDKVDDLIQLWSALVIFAIVGFGMGYMLRNEEGRWHRGPILVCAFFALMTILLLHLVPHPSAKITYISGSSEGDDCLNTMPSEPAVMTAEGLEPSCLPLNSGTPMPVASAGEVRSEYVHVVEGEWGDLSDNELWVEVFLPTQAAHNNRPQWYYSPAIRKSNKHWVARVTIGIDGDESKFYRVGALNCADAATDRLIHHSYMPVNPDDAARRWSYRWGDGCVAQALAARWLAVEAPSP